MQRERKAVLVVGMHRSGTSALAASLIKAGFQGPADPLAPQVDNPTGFWEPTGAVRLNNEILAELGGDWKQPGPYLVPDMTVGESTRATDDFVAEVWLQEAMRRLDASFPASGVAVVKDPRIPVFLPLWRQALDELGYRSTVVVVYRNPLEVSASLWARDRLGPRRAFQMWQQTYWRAFTLAAAGEVGAVISYETVLTDPIAAVDAVRRAVGIRTRLSAERRGQVEAGVETERRHHTGPGLTDPGTRTLPPLVRETWLALARMEEEGPSVASAWLAQLQMRYEEAVAFAGPAIGLTDRRMDEIRAAHQPAPAVVPATEDLSDKPLVLHYHLFKNAGTSVDEALKRNFGRAWGYGEFRISPGASNRAEVAGYLAGRNGLKAFSSHTALLPEPDLNGRPVLPVLFVRHPIDRIRSAYEFERKQIADTRGAKLAKLHDFAGYLRALLDEPGQRQARNFQSCRLALGLGSTPGTELERSLGVVDRLPFIGLVEQYELSMLRLQELLQQWYPDFEAHIVRRNVTRETDKKFDVRLEQLREELGHELYDELAAANADDIQIFERVRTIYEQ